MNILDNKHGKISTPPLGGHSIVIYSPLLTYLYYK